MWPYPLFGNHFSYTVIVSVQTAILAGWGTAELHYYRIVCRFETV